MDKVILVKYGEIGLKGLNRYEFEDALERNIKVVLRDFQGTEVTRSAGRLWVAGVPDYEEALRRLSRVPGIVGLHPSVMVEKRMDAIEAAAAALMEAETAELTSFTFKAFARRADKSFPVESPEIARKVGAAVLRAIPKASVDLYSPQIALNVEVREGGAYLYCREIPGPGGLPVGVSGKGLLLISGGIDSPVAGYLAMKRGLRVDALHFWSYPITGEMARDKVAALCRILRGSDPALTLYIAPFTRVQTSIMEHCPERYRVTVMRRMMMRIASAWSSRIGAQVIVTGENLGQVASQTVESLTAIEDAATLPVIRPLICFDKLETVELARKIGTFETSCLPYEDCCTVFVPKHPVTKPKLSNVLEAEKNLPVEELVSDCVEHIEAFPLD